MVKKSNSILAIFGFVLILFQRVEAQYTVNILLNEFNNGQGFLANGTHCDDFWFAGSRCNIQLKIGVGFNSTTCDEYIDLGNVTINANSIVFGEQTYGSWVNPSSFPKPGQYAGFSLCVEATEAKNKKLIDSFTTPPIGADQISDFTYYSHPRGNGLIEPTMIAFAWYVQGNVSSPQSTAPPPPSTTTPAPGNGSMDCEAAFQQNNYSTSTTVTLGLTNGNTVEVWCEYNSRLKSVQTVFQSRGSVNATMDDFSKLEFADFINHTGTPGLDSNFWMGLENLHAFTMGRNQRYDMRIIACCGTTKSVVQVYQNVTIGDAASGYRIYGVGDPTVGLAKKTIFTDFGQPFKTTNSSSFVPPISLCPVIHNSETNEAGGWWFGNCQDNLNGYYYYLRELEEGTCRLSDKTNGTGIVLYNGETLANSAQNYNEISYTRVRMAFHRTGAAVADDPNFCTSPYMERDDF
uniref:Fibrinogen C-terminal domain-containing protein n=1 Tax=Panagrolaimus sp. JU765 TaxID=591449 RepID=A0AC34QJU9_9BILA